MFNDMRASSELMKKFGENKLAQAQDNKINFHVHMLTASYWPAYPPCRAILPKEMLACTTAFSKYYNDNDKLTFKQIGEKTKIEEKVFSDLFRTTNLKN